MPLRRLRSSLSLLKKKRKASESRAKCWECFVKTKDEVGGPTAKCKYYGKIFYADCKKNDTSSLRNYILAYLKMPYSKDTR